MNTLVSLFPEEYYCEVEVSDYVQHNKGNSLMVSLNCNNFKAEILISCSMGCTRHPASPYNRLEAWPCRKKNPSKWRYKVTAAIRRSSLFCKLCLFPFSFLFILIHTHIFPFWLYFCVRADTTILIPLYALSTRKAVKAAGGTKNGTSRALLH